MEDAEADLRAAGKSEREIASYKELFQEVQRQIDSKQLRPFIRTQYMRTAFQVRVETAGTKQLVFPGSMCQGSG